MSTSSYAELTTEHFIAVCGICLSAYEAPKALPCLHSFCLACIRKWASHVSSRKTDPGSSHVVPCPTCRKDCTLTATGVDGLPTNFFITERNRVQEPPKCNSCGKGDHEIIARCRECGFVCTECMSPHKSMRMLQDHSVIMLDTLRVGKVSKQLSMSQISSAGHRKPGSGTFKLEKTVDLKSVDSSINNAWCCSVNKSDSSYQIVVPHYSSGGKVYIIGVDGKQKMVFETTEGDPPGLSGSPWNAVESSDGYIYITNCSPWVKVHNKEMKFMHLFQIHDVNGAKCTQGNARGIAIDSKGQIIVGNVSNKTISIYQPDESLVKAFQIELLPCYISVKFPDNTLLISGLSEVRVLEVDYSGRVLKEITSPLASLTWKPRGVCCSKNGEIFIVNSANGQCCVCRFTGSWNFTGCVISELKDPSGIAVSEDGELLALVESSPELKIYRRY